MGTTTHSASFLPESNPHDLDLLVKAQHFGLKTRLLDWTSNALVALWFACSDIQKGDSYVYALEADSLQVEDVYKKKLFEQTHTRVFQPKLNNVRIIAQHGWFTLHMYAKSTKSFVALEKNSTIKKHLIEYKVPSTNRSSILDSLDRNGVNHRTLFPDLEGLCKHLNWKHNNDFRS
jgi:hypothetical protein